ncbi:hypothetical protein HDV06_001058 [Boothiomyces sp. JEL0866]|nr:hypothetical protein HDV06_001058 [Boothiomyces sp. JEL0866]
MTFNGSFDSAVLGVEIIMLILLAAHFTKLFIHKHERTMLISLSIIIRIVFLIIFQERGIIDLAGIICKWLSAMSLYVAIFLCVYFQTDFLYKIVIISNFPRYIIDIIKKTLVTLAVITLFPPIVCMLVFTISGESASYLSWQTVEGYISITYNSILLTYELFQCFFLLRIVNDYVETKYIHHQYESERKMIESALSTHNLKMLRISLVAIITNDITCFTLYALGYVYDNDFGRAVETIGSVIVSIHVFALEYLLTIVKNVLLPKNSISGELLLVQPNQDKVAESVMNCETINPDA